MLWSTHIHASPWGFRARSGFSRSNYRGLSNYSSKTPKSRATYWATLTVFEWGTSSTFSIETSLLALHVGRLASTTHLSLPSLPHSGEEGTGRKGWNYSTSPSRLGPHLRYMKKSRTDSLSLWSISKESNTWCRSSDCPSTVSPTMEAVGSKGWS